MTPDLWAGLALAVGGFVVDLAHRKGWLKPSSPAPTPSPTPAPVTPANGEADKPAVEFLTWLMAVNAGTIKLDDYDREVLKRIAGAMPEGGAPSSPIIDDVVKRLLAALASKNAVAGA
jgi:hypothetical protein